MIVNVRNKQKSLKISPDQVIKVVEWVLEEDGEICDEVSVYFVNTSTIAALHQEFFNDPSPTDCISFPIDDHESLMPYRILGEIFICPATALDYAKQHQKDPYEETTLYIVHGLLHLMGYDDREVADRKWMKQAERRHMRNLKKLHLQLTPTPIK